MGFRRDTTHHQMFWYFDDDRKTSIRTRTSHGEKEFDDSLLAMRRKQIGSLSKAQFLALLNGSLSPAVFLPQSFVNTFSTMEFFKHQKMTSNHPTLAECYQVAALNGSNKLRLLWNGGYDGNSYADDPHAPLELAA